MNNAPQILNLYLQVYYFKIFGGVNLNIKNFIGHLKTITYHKIIVFKLCVKAGITFRGLVHDLSKYSPTEFWEGVKYYQKGKRSPISYCREVTRVF